MAIINSYPSITELKTGSLLLVSDTSVLGNPTKTTSVADIVALIPPLVPGGGTMSNWRISDSFVTGSVTNNEAVVFEGGTKIGTTLLIAGGNPEKLTISHLSTTRTDTTSSSSPAAGATFTCIDSVTQDATGHPTAVNVKTVTLPSSSGVTSVNATNSTFISGVASPSPIIATGTLAYSLSATGTPSSTTFLRGDNTWATPAASSVPTYFSVNSSGNIVNSGNIADNNQGFGTITTALNSGGTGITITFANTQSNSNYIINFTLEQPQIDSGNNYAPRGYVPSTSKSTSNFTIIYVKPSSIGGLGFPVLTNFQLYR